MSILSSNDRSHKLQTLQFCSQAADCILCCCRLLVQFELSHMAKKHIKEKKMLQEFFEQTSFELFYIYFFNMYISLRKKKFSQRTYRLQFSLEQQHHLTVWLVNVAIIAWCTCLDGERASLLYKLSGGVGETHILLAFLQFLRNFSCN